MQRTPLHWHTQWLTDSQWLNVSARVISVRWLVMSTDGSGASHWKSVVCQMDGRDLYRKGWLPRMHSRQLCLHWLPRETETQCRVRPCVGGDFWREGRAALLTGHQRHVTAYVEWRPPQAPGILQSAEKSRLEVMHWDVRKTGFALYEILPSRKTFKTMSGLYLNVPPYQVRFKMSHHAKFVSKRTIIPSLFQNVSK